jgi:hypothetical protein
MTPQLIPSNRNDLVSPHRNFNSFPSCDARSDWTGRLHRALEKVNKAPNDVAQEEGNAFAKGLQQRPGTHRQSASPHLASHRDIEDAIETIR